MDNLERIRKLIENFKAEQNSKINLLYDEPMKEHTTFQIGGNAPFYFEPQEEYFLQTLDFLVKNNIPYFILGGGSNIVVSDEGFEAAVISTAALNSIKQLSCKNNICLLQCGAGVKISDFVKYCTENCLSGMEKFSGLPGTVGGAVYMNARCFAHSVSSLFFSAQYIDFPLLEIKTCSFISKEWGYKISPFKNTKKIILSAVFSLNKKSNEEKEKITSDCKKYIEERRNRGHFKFPSAGSVFMNNTKFGLPSGQIISQSGLCGKKIGGAQVADWHGNIIINTGNASQKDVKNLVEFIVNKIEKERGIKLEPEIIFCGK